MELYFKNDGIYGKQAVGRPVKYKDDCIGFIKSVSEDYVTLVIWDAHSETTRQYALQNTQDVDNFNLSKDKCLINKN